MSRRYLSSSVVACAIAAALSAGMLRAADGAERAPLALNAVRITIEGTSNLHPYSATSTAARVTRVQLGHVDGDAFWTSVTAPGVLHAFELKVPVTSLSSPKDGLDKNMHKALRAQEHPDITFRLARLEPAATAGALRAAGSLIVAGVEREVTLDLTTEAKDGALAVTGAIDLLMTDFGIAPPRAMLGMLRTDPKVTVRFEALIAASLT